MTQAAKGFSPGLVGRHFYPVQFHMHGLRKELLKRNASAHGRSLRLSLSEEDVWNLESRLHAPLSMDMGGTRAASLQPRSANRDLGSLWVDVPSTFRSLGEVRSFFRATKSPKKEKGWRKSRCLPQCWIVGSVTLLQGDDYQDITQRFP